MNGHKRALAVSTLSVVTLVTLTGCLLPVPTRPLMHGPVSLTVIDDRLSWVLCYDSSISVKHFSTTIEQVSDGTSQSWPVFVGEMDGDQTVELPAREPILLKTLSELMPVVESVDVPVSSLERNISVFLVINGPDTQVEMKFRDVDISSLSEGNYVYYSGEVKSDPCEMSSDEYR